MHQEGHVFTNKWPNRLNLKVFSIVRNESIPWPLQGSRINYANALGKGLWVLWGLGYCRVPSTRVPDCIVVTFGLHCTVHDIYVCWRGSRKCVLVNSFQKRIATLDSRKLQSVRPPQSTLSFPTPKVTPWIIYQIHLRPLWAWTGVAFARIVNYALDSSIYAPIYALSYMGRRRMCHKEHQWCKIYWMHINCNGFPVVLYGTLDSLANKSMPWFLPTIEEDYIARPHKFNGK